MPEAPLLLALADFEPAPEAASTDIAVRGELQELTRRIAFAPESWSRDDAASMRSRFDERAATWATRDAPEYRLPLEDALRRGGVPRRGRCLEVGSGTGIQTPTLVAHFDEVLSIEIAPEMFRQTPSGSSTRVLADAASLPLGDGTLDAIVCVNAPLFAPEYSRVLARAGAVVFVSTRGSQTPIYLAPADVVAALASLGDRRFTATTARAGQGTWTVARRDAAPPGSDTSGEQVATAMGTGDE